MAQRIAWPRVACGLIMTLSLGACTSLRTPALTLSKAGQQTTAASAQSLRGVAENVGGLVEMNLVRQAVAGCAQDIKGHAAATAAAAAEKKPAPPPLVCKPVTLPDDVPVLQANNALANVILLRVKAINKINDAYAEMQKEAEYDARGELEGAIGEAAGSVNGLAAAVAAAGGPALGAPLAVAVPVVKRLAGESAQAAQNRRLVEASKQLKAIDQRLITLLAAEQDLYAGMGASLAMNRSNVTDAMLATGVADPMRLVNEFTTGLGLSTSPDLKPGNAQSVVIARTMSKYRAQKAVAVSGATYAANVKALKALVEEHEKFETDASKVSLDGVTGAIDELKGWAEIVQEVQDATKAGGNP
ncbi:hypothetical protein [Phenylobacterium sp.]|uniref:hypothetical protein n=1 Tax=Phenylobacterium sp. TaxID=1871053 RepID=UPI0025DF756F|nr:hypothetical protein [Phenylobacterium sp.]